MYSLSIARKCEDIYEILIPTITVCSCVLRPAAVHCCQTLVSMQETPGFHYGCELKRRLILALNFRVSDLFYRLRHNAN